MEEKKCKHCAMMIPKDAKICPHCKEKQGTSLLVGFLAIIAVFIFIGIIASMISTKTSAPNTYTAEQKKAAKELQDILLKSGFVTKLSSEGQLQVFYVNRGLWRATPYEKKKELLGNLSKSNEIQGFTPWIEIRDYRSGKVYGALKPPLTMDIYE
jgi:hypothetical protein